MGAQSDAELSDLTPQLCAAGTRLLQPGWPHACHLASALPTPQTWDKSAQPVSPAQLIYVWHSMEQLLAPQQGLVSGASSDVPAAPGTILL